ncbi:hypothetical protein MPER_07819, partial [Moniliophthora perniciosa FA553]
MIHNASELEHEADTKTTVKQCDIQFQQGNNFEKISGLPAGIPALRLGLVNVPPELALLMLERFFLSSSFTFISLNLFTSQTQSNLPYQLLCL